MRSWLGSATDYVSPKGQRLRKSDGSTGTTYFAPDTGNHLLAEDDNDAWVDYVWLNGRLVDRIAGGAVDAIHDDQTGRPQVVTAADQAVVWKADNGPFDRTVVQDDIGGLNLGFPGQYYDAERWLWNNGYRDYIAGFGRYNESDPRGLGGGVNTYVYVEGNPVNRTDPFGLCDQQKCTAARAMMASLGQQLSSAGKIATWAGVGVVSGAAIAGLFAPEGAPAEFGAADVGLAAIRVGGAASTLGATLTGYARNGIYGAAIAGGESYFVGKYMENLAGALPKASLLGEANRGALSSMLEEIPDALQQEEEACASN